ncbi:MAG: carboxylesterase/lipase family protein, partial [Polyangiales bacterium]
MAASDDVVETTAGRVRGSREHGVSVFRGIPYGDDTGGANRFRPPQPARTWPGVRECTRYGATAVQLRPPVDPQRPPDPLSELGLPMGEDCLVLNVWTPSTTGRRPVMVWLHGGGFSIGSGSSPLYAGANLARRGDVVVVTLNHRLGLLGFSHLEDHFGGSYAGSSNAGILDLIAALEWIKSNIERFGGDSGCVTIFGESGGGGKVSALLAAPKARGLFQRAIIQSGPPFQFPHRSTARATTDQVLAQLGLKGSDGPAGLHELPFDRLLKAQIALGAGGGPSPGGMSFAPTIDERVLFDWPEQALAGGASADVPLLIGTNLNEARFMVMINPHLRKSPPALTASDLLERVSPGCDRGAADLIARYRELHPDLSNFDLLLEIESEQFRIRSIRLAEHKAAGGTAPVFMYLFRWVTPRLAKYGAYHGLEIPFVFDTVATVPHVAADEEAGVLCDRMLASWVAFARTGRPGCDATPSWKPYGLEERATMEIDRNWTLASDPLARERTAWHDVPTGPTSRP